jgi:hypothetical protein
MLARARARFEERYGDLIATSRALRPPQLSVTSTNFALQAYNIQLQSCLPQ